MHNTDAKNTRTNKAHAIHFSPMKSRRKGKKHHNSTTTTKRSDLVTEEIKTLTQRIVDESPARGNVDISSSSFPDLPLSKATLIGLRDNAFKHMTRIQRIAIPHALAGRDVLGAAKTGSGKTLAFLIPTLEKLYRERWGEGDGVGALIVSPTRELALQIFEVLRKLAQRHVGMTAALITGGKDFSSEQDHIARMNIIVCTPGRLLQHFEQTPGFHCEDLKVLVLDEADRILDMGFENELNAILSHLPLSGSRQTLLFSATQTKSVKQLARLSLTHPEYVSVHESARFATPERLKQHVAEVALPQKIDVVYSFIRTHLRHKIIIFFSSCKQVRFVYEGLRRLRPGVPLMALHGKVKQARRSYVYQNFVDKKPGHGVVLFATDIAARGLDFPGVDWVIQADAPEDVATYIHRVGRTARFKKTGRSLLLLCPSEMGFQDLLEKAKVPVEKIAINPDKMITSSVKDQFASHAAQDPDFKYLAQKCFISYMRSVYVRKNKKVFNVKKLPAMLYAESLGLPSMPRIKMLRNAGDSDSEEEDNGGGGGGGGIKIKNQNKKLMRLKANIAADKLKKRNEMVQKRVASESAAAAASKGSQKTTKTKTRKKRKNNDSDSDGSSSSGSSSGSSSSSGSDSDSSDEEEQDNNTGGSQKLGQLDQLMKRKNAGVLNRDRENIRDMEVSDVLYWVPREAVRLMVCSVYCRGVCVALPGGRRQQRR